MFVTKSKGNRPHEPDARREFSDGHACNVQVRDAACLACGQYVLAYPEEARGSLDQLYALWFDHLTETIPSVRAGAAAALANAVRAYHAEALDVVLPKLRCGTLCAGAILY